MSTSKASAAIPVSMLAVGLALIMLASLAVVQTDRMTVSPVQMDLTSLFEPKTGQLTFEAPPYCSRFDIFCFIAFIFKLIFDRFAAIFGLIFGGGAASAAKAANAASRAKVTNVPLDSCASGRAGRSCRRAQNRNRR